jgi:prepilin-type N-terminal cleavage/methylation domain-containing protein
MSTRGFALSELLVAVAIGGLILTGLTWLQVDYVALARRVGELGAPFVAGTRLQRAAAMQVRCGQPGAVLQLSDDGGLVAVKSGQSTNLIAVSRDRGRTTLAASTGGAASFLRPVQILAGSAALGDGAPRPGWSAVAIEAGGTTVAVLGARCDLPEVCEYDGATDRCLGDK